MCEHLLWQNPPSLHKCHIQSNELQRSVGLFHFYPVYFSNLNAENYTENVLKSHQNSQSEADPKRNPVKATQRMDFENPG